MCDFFSCIVTKDAAVLFTEVDSHDEVILRSGLKNDTKDFVRIEYTEKKGYRIDEKTIPEWYERTAALAEQAVIAIYRRIQPSWSKYDIVLQSVLSEYDTLEQSVLSKHNKILLSSLFKYNKILRSALSKYKRDIEDVQGYTESLEVGL